MVKSVFTLILAVSIIGTTIAQDYPEMIKVEGGVFMMGSKNGQSDEAPVHHVKVSTFYIAKTETTVVQWKAFCKATGRTFPAPPVYGWKDDAPIANINWDDAVAYTKWLTLETGKNYRIPTEAEWEFAARGGILSKGYSFSGSNNIDSVAWYNGNSNNQTRSVAEKIPNELGLYDMTGNVWEWTNDIYSTYDTAAVINPRGGMKGAAMVFKGGGIMEPPTYNRISMRGRSTNHLYSFRDLGLRVACD